MPPKRKTSGGPGTKRGGRVTRAASKVQPQPPDEALKVEQVKEEAEEVKLEEKAPIAEQKSSPARVKEEPDSRRVESGSLAYKSK